MALAPRSSLRSLLLLMSHGKPQLSSFSSSSVARTGVPPVAPGADTPPAAPAVQPPVTTARSDRSCPKLPGGPRTYEEETVLQPLHGVTDKACLNAPQDPSAYPTPDHGSCRTPEPVPVEPPSAIPESPMHPEVPIHKVRDPPPRTRRGAVTNGSRGTPETVPVKPPRDISEGPGHEIPRHPIHDPPPRTHRGAVTNGSCGTPEPAPVHVPVKPPRGISEDVKHKVGDPPRRPKAVTEQPAQCSPAAPAV
ncbi:proline-rich receptor-like protein kinase PERK9 [Triticum dicoccoides]|uniref:proline-rich receptor-like protein kinase PERK9 n=1 Tax=Triticum dicoccoides TaxID=85692 RepID=UPI000E78908B|nr:proline-rich receptor-like protein kinase PERK9 [Triticum dicoccoides]